jgi:hypothetical protein
MKSLTLNVPRSGLYLKLAATSSDAQVVVVAPDEVTISEAVATKAGAVAPASIQTGLFRQPVKTITTDNGFPPRRLTEHAIAQIIREHGGSVKIRDQSTGWNIYDEIAARLGVSIEARRRLTAGTSEPAWRPEIGYARKNLEQAGTIKPTEQSGRGVWALSSNQH